MRRTSCLLALALVAASGVLSGCAKNAPGDLSPAAKKVLAPAVQHVREVATAGSYQELRAAVADLKDLVQHEEQSGDVTPSRAAAIDDAADVLLLDAKPKPSPTPTTTSPTPTPTPTSESPTPSITPTTTSPTTTTSPIVSTSVSAAGRSPGGGSPSAEPSTD
ncbi:MAG: hypothetical protein QOJ03_124 [Frankiaceae bacterium]|jgi:hypothetical protein|nr:hypothetical protein [Frankiaceae bacterium]